MWVEERLHNPSHRRRGWRSRALKRRRPACAHMFRTLSNFRIWALVSAEPAWALFYL